MNVLAWLMVFPILEFAYIDSANINGYKLPEHSTEITIGAEAVAFDFLYVKGGKDWIAETIKEFNTRNDEAARKEERERCNALLSEFFEIYNSDGVTFWVDYTPNNDAHDIYKRFQKWKSEAIRKMEDL